VEVDIVEGDADELTLPTGRLDAVISRSMLMYLADPAASLTRLRAGLRPGGRLAASTWSGPEEVAMAAPVPIIRRLLDLPPPPTGQPGLFALSDPQRLHEVITAAGFTEGGAGHRHGGVRVRLPRRGNPVHARLCATGDRARGAPAGGGP
jgi:SAM-dependent methyltransferase